MGKSSKPTIGFWYQMGIHFGLCMGPVDALLEIRGGDRTAWIGNVTGSTSIQIAARNLYGGDKKEGGIEGQLDVMMGEDTQAPNAYLESIFGAPQPAYRGLTTATFNGIVGAMNPYIKAWAFKVIRCTAGWRTPVWQPALARIGDGMNAAHIIYQLCCEVRGWDPNEKLDLTRMQQAAQTLYDEGLGLCLKWSRADSLDSFVQTICGHVGGMMVEDPSTGLHYLRLLRADYDPATLPALDESNIVDVVSYEQPQLDGSVNQVTVVYRDSVTNKDAAVTVQNLANVQAQGTVIAKQVSYPGAWNGDVAARLAARDCQSESSLLAGGELIVQRSDTDILRGEVRALSWTFGNVRIDRMPVRILEVDEGTPTDSKVKIKWAQDQFGLPATTYMQIQPSLPDPDLSPQPVTAQLAFEASYRDLATRLRPVDLAALADDAGYVATLGARPAGVPYNYTLMTRIKNVGSYGERGSGDFAPTGLLIADIGPTDTAIALTSFRNLDLIEVGSEALIDSELVRVDAINPQAGTATIARGCVDTVPAAHLAGTRFWATDNYTGADTTEYVAGETVQALLLTRSGLGELDMALATAVEVTLASRQVRPYPPGNLKVQGARYPTTVEGALSLTWSHRDRTLQADQLVDTLQADVGPEPGTTYTVKVYLANVLDSTITGIAGTTTTPAVSGDGTVRVEITAQRDGFGSWQPLNATFDYLRAPALATEAGDPLAAEDGTTIILES